MSDPVRVHELFMAALDQPEAKRMAWLATCAGSDSALFDEVAALLAADRGGQAQTDPIDRLIGQSAAELTPESANLIGHRLGAWRIRRHIASGGMGQVFLAERDDGEYRARAAIKLLRGFPDALALERMRRERQILANLSHPNIARLLDGGSTADGQPWLAIEWIDGQTIDRWCADRELGIQARVRLMLKVCLALEAAHQRLIVHRDIKPGNVLVDHDGEPRLLDFGIARLLDDGDDAAAVTRLRYYTPQYSSPEQVRGEAVTTLADVYSLGRLLETVLQAGRTKPLLPAELAALIAQASDPEPALRPPSVRALAEDLDNWLADRPVRAARPGRWLRLAKFARRHRAAVVVGLAGAVVAVGLAVWIMLENSRARAAELEARRAATHAEQVLDFVTGMIAAARPGVADGRALTVAEVLEAGERQQRAARIDDPVLNARMNLALGQAWQALETLPPAIDRLGQASDEALAGGDVATALKAMADQVIVMTWDSRIEAAGQVLERAFELLAARPETSPALEAELYNARGVWGLEADQLDQAHADLSRALAIRERIAPQSAELDATLHTLGLAARFMGDPDRALDYLDRSLAMKERRDGRINVRYAQTLQSRGIALRELGRFEEAAATIEAMVDIRHQLFGDADPQQQSSANELANIWHDRGDYVRAIAFYHQALEADRRHGGDTDGFGSSSWVYLNNLAAAHEDRGDLAEAERLLHTSIALRAELFGPDHRHTLRARDNLSRVLISLGRFDEAEVINQAVLAVRREELDPGHPDRQITELRRLRLAAARAPDQPESVLAYVEAVEAWLPEQSPASLRALAQRGLAGRALIELGQLERAERHLLTAIDGYRQALAPDHPMAAELELQLARIDRLRGQDRAAIKRVATIRPILDAALHESAASRRLAAQLASELPGSPELGR